MLFCQKTSRYKCRQTKEFDTAPLDLSCVHNGGENCAERDQLRLLMRVSLVAFQRQMSVRHDALCEHAKGHESRLVGHLV